jgi:gas vesicle protein
MKDSGKILIGALSGLAAGLVLGILFAPDKGSETRKKIGNSAKDLSDKLKTKISDTLDYISELEQEAEYAAGAYADDGKHNGTKSKAKV